jgi:uncharacterized protein YdhG (YjbR/CyaY superfamily)
MKKKESGDSSDEKQEKGAPKTVDEYLAGVEEPVRAVLITMRAAVQAALPREATEIISYRMPTFKHNKVLVWLAAFKDHCRLFPTAAVINAFKDEFKGFSTSKGTVQFPTDKPLPAALIKKLVKARLEQCERNRRHP